MRIGIDFDGTLVDSKKRHTQALTLASDMEEVSLPSELIESFVKGKSLGHTGYEVLNWYNVPKKRKIINNWIELIESESLLTLDSLYPDVENLLNKYTVKGMRFYLVTKRRNLQGTLNQIKRLGISRYLEAIHVVNQNAQLNSSKRYNSLKAECTDKYKLDCVIGDTEDDYEWANALSVKFYALSCGFRNKHFWEKKYIDSFSSLTQLFYVLEKEFHQRL